jgi:transcriptional regulator with PAS, ATPase and Fis domain
VTQEALALLLDYNWPGNVRELENAIEHAYVRSKTQKIDADSLPPAVALGTNVKNISEERTHNISENIQVLQRNHVNELLIRYKGNKSLVARNLGISRTTLWRMLKKAH